MINKILVFLLFGLFVFPPQVYPDPESDWVKSWVGQATVTSSDYSKQKKGQVTGGGGISANIPIAIKTEFAIGGPYIRSVNGGINLMEGGISFMDAERLVKKFQNIISAAPAIAFDIALKTVANSLSTSMKEMESIANTLNNAYADGSAAVRGLYKKAADVFDPVQKSVERMESALTNLGGDGTSNNSIKARIDNNIEAIMGSLNEPSWIEKKCGDDIEKLLTGGSFIGNMLKNKDMNTNTKLVSFIPTLRGLFGDLMVMNNGKTYEFSILKSCPNNKPTSILQSLVDGGMGVRFIDSTDCKDGPKEGVRGWSLKKLSTLTESIKNKDKSYLSDKDVTNYLNSLPLDIQSMLKFLIAYSGKDSATTLGDINEVVSWLYANQIAGDFINILENTINSAEKLYYSGTDKANCDMKVFEGFIGALKEFKTRQIDSAYINIYNEYKQHSEISKGIFDLNETYKKKATDFESIVSKKFGSSFSSK